MKKWLMMIVAACVAGGFAAPAMAKHNKAPRAKAAATTETKTKHHHGFKATDANSDGKITFDEFKAGRPNAKKPKKLDKRFNRRDQNSDNSITREEWKATKRHHQKADATASAKKGKAGKTGKRHGGGKKS